MPTEQDVYNVVAYPGFPYPNTHPDRLAVMGLLHGLDPAPVASCHVLEIGCNEGANLVPMAYAIPGSEFVGFDLAALPIERGQQRIRELGLSNIRLLRADLLQPDLKQIIAADGAAPGTFDYIIAHGVYAWVAEPVRERLLAVCRELLAPEGIAFVSYNALPGSHGRNLVREIVLQGFSGEGDAARNIAQGMELLEFTIECRPEGDPMRALLEREKKKLLRKRPETLYHDELATHHRPVSFSSFIGHAGRNGLQYVSESSLPGLHDPSLQPRIAEMAMRLADGDPIAEEQIFDFARMRVYRETLLCHADRAVDRRLCLEALGMMRLASPAELSPEAENGLRVFKVPGVDEMKSEHPTTLAVMEYLIAAWPEAVPFAELEAVLEAKGIAVDAEMLTLLMRLVVTRAVQLHEWAAPVSRTIEDRPRASAVSRHDAATRDVVTTLLHEALKMEDPLVKQFLPLLDGTRDRKALLQALRLACPETPEATLAEGIDPALRFLHRTGTLLAIGFA